MWEGNIAAGMWVGLEAAHVFPLALDQLFNRLGYSDIIGLDKKFFSMAWGLPPMKFRRREPPKLSKFLGVAK